MTGPKLETALQGLQDAIHELDKPFWMQQKSSARRKRKFK